MPAVVAEVLCLLTKPARHSPRRSAERGNRGWQLVAYCWDRHDRLGVIVVLSISGRRLGVRLYFQTHEKNITAKRRSRLSCGGYTGCWEGCSSWCWTDGPCITAGDSGASGCRLTRRARIR